MSSPKGRAISSSWSERLRIRSASRASSVRLAICCQTVPTIASMPTTATGASQLRRAAASASNVIAATATVGALLIDLRNYKPFLYLLGSFFVPLFAVLLADWLLAGRHYGFGDVFHAPRPREWTALRRGKLPDLRSPLTRELALDTLYTLLADGDFDNEQDAIDAELAAHAARAA